MNLPRAKQRSSQAQFMPVVEKANTTTMLVPACDLCTGGTIETVTTVTFSQEWCASPGADAYEIVVEDRATMGGDGYKTLQVQLKEPMMDCMGPAYKRTFTLTTQEIGEYDRVIIMNPSVLK